MMRAPRWLSRIVVGVFLIASAAVPAASQTTTRGHGAEAHDMELVGHDELQSRSAYQPTIHQQRGRFIAYVGHHGGRARNPLTGADEDNGTSIVDVTDPARPRYLAHIPGMPGGPEQGGAQMVRVCDRQGKTYVLRTFGNSLPNSGHEVWDATDAAKPRRVSTVVSGLTSTHKNWWECDTGIAYLISGDLAKTDPLQLGPSRWRTWRMTKIYDLSDPATPVFIRDFGLAGQEPGSIGPIPVAQGAHGPIVLGNRAYFAYGTSSDGVLPIVARQKLPTGLQVPESQGNFCRRGGRFGPHSSSESFAPIFYKKLVFLAYFNGGVRAMDIRNPYAPREAGFYIPATTERTAERCVTNGTRSCKVAIQTNNVEADERGFVYLADRANTGLHIVRLTGEAAKIIAGN